MELAQLVVLSLFGILIFLMITDELFAHYVYLFINLLIVQTKLFYWRMKLHPKNYLTKWLFDRRLKESSKKYTDYE